MFWWQSLKERKYLENLSTDGRRTLKQILKEQDSKGRNGFV
jgi:hypothetical protein